jgi:hypothetical protein
MISFQSINIPLNQWQDLLNITVLNKSQYILIDHFNVLLNIYNKNTFPFLKKILNYLMDLLYQTINSNKNIKNIYSVHMNFSTYFNYISAYQETEDLIYKIIYRLNHVSSINFLESYKNMLLSLENFSLQNNLNTLREINLILKIGQRIAIINKFRNDLFMFQAKTSVLIYKAINRLNDLNLSIKNMENLTFLREIKTSEDKIEYTSSEVFLSPCIENKPKNIHFSSMKTYHGKQVSSPSGLKESLSTSVNNQITTHKKNHSLNESLEFKDSSNSASNSFITFRSYNKISYHSFFYELYFVLKQYKKEDNINAYVYMVRKNIEELYNKYNFNFYFSLNNNSFLSNLKIIRDNIYFKNFKPLIMKQYEIVLNEIMSYIYKISIVDIYINSAVKYNNNILKYYYCLFSKYLKILNISALKQNTLDYKNHWKYSTNDYNILIELNSLNSSDIDNFSLIPLYGNSALILKIISNSLEKVVKILYIKSSEIYLNLDSDYIKNIGFLCNNISTHINEIINNVYVFYAYENSIYLKNIIKISREYDGTDSYNFFLNYVLEEYKNELFLLQRGLNLSIKTHKDLKKIIRMHEKN